MPENTTNTNDGQEPGETLLAVYGTLKRGFSNHHVMGGARYLGLDRLVQILLYDLGPFPGALLAPSEGIEVEVFRVNASQLARVDDLEEYCAEDPGTGLYTRVQLPTRYGPAWVYLYQGALTSAVCQTAGAWQETEPLENGGGI